MTPPADGDGDAGSESDESTTENTDRGDEILDAIRNGFEGSGEGPYPDMISGDGDIVMDTSDSASSDFIAKQRKIERFRERLEERGELTDEQIRRRIKLRTGALRPPSTRGARAAAQSEESGDTTSAETDMAPDADGENGGESDDESEYEYGESDIVTFDGETAVVTSVMTESFDASTENTDGDDEETIDASEDEPRFIILLESGSWAAVTADELEPGEWDEPEPETEKLAEADLAPIYSEAVERGMTITDLANIRGVRDPHVGFDDLPEGWTHKSVLQAYASLGASFDTCRIRMAGDVRNPTRFCAALKDESYGTTMWRSWE